MARVKLTVRLPEENVDFLKRFARDHGVTATEVLDRYLRRLRTELDDELHPAVEQLIGLIPADTDVRREHLDYLEKKHR